MSDAIQNLPPPKPMSMEGDLGTNWKKFVKNYLLYARATEITKKSKETQAAILLHCIGEEALEIFDTFELNNEESNQPEVILANFEAYFIPKCNRSVESHKFNTRTQRPNETFDNFLADLRKLSANCEFGNLRDRLLKDRIVSGIYDQKVKERLLRETELTLSKAVDICRAAEQTESHIKLLSTETNKLEINVLKTKPYKDQPVEPRGHETKNQQVGSHHRRDRKSEGQYHGEQQKCGRCGYRHKKFNCPAVGKQCNKCKKYNHFAKVCKNRIVNVIDVKPESTNKYVLAALGNKNSTDLDWLEIVTFLESNKKVRFKLDTGAHVNVIPEYILKVLGLQKLLKKTNVKISNYGGEQLKVLGSCDLTVVTKNNGNQLLNFIIVDTGDQAAPILGLESIQKLNLLQRNQNILEIKMENNILFKHQDVFNGIGKIKMDPCEFRLRDDYKAVIVPTRRVPFDLMPALKKELGRMIQDGIICRINEPTEFVNPIVLVRKPDGSLRICLDPQNLNQSIMREHFEIPTFDEITRDMVGSKYFSILDANKGFYQIELAKRSSKLTTFCTPFGRYRFLRLPFGLSNAPEIFHRTFTEIFGQIEGVKIYIDDIIIYAKTMEQHDKILEQVLDKAKEKGVRFNKNKCKFRAKEVKYVGHILTEEGIKIDEEKVEAIKRITKPTSAKELSRFLGMITYVGKFIPNLAKHTANLRILLKQDCLWQWNDQHDKEFIELKNLLSSTPVLHFYDRNKPIVLSVDSSKDGMGAVLLQEGAPVAYASKTLTETQKNYAQIEKETLAMVFGCQRFHQYLYGREFIIESDHKPLEAIFKKSLNKCPLRLQRLRITLQSYNFEVKYKPGSQLLLADALSRASYADKNFDVIESDVEAQVNLINYCSISPKKFEQLRAETEKDKELKLLIGIIKEGWPENKKRLDPLVKPYWKYREDLVEMRGIVCKCEQLVIPKSMRAEIINRLHYNHMGIEKTLLRAKEHVFWPLMGKEITDVVKNCPACLKHMNANQKETLINRELATRPWEIVATDLYHLLGKDYLLVVDTFSRYPEVYCMKQDTTHTKIVEAMKEIFARHGKPEILYSGNDTQFVNSHFQQFLEEWEITHKTSSPRNPQSNGFIERHVQTIKKLLRKAIYDSKDTYLTLLEYRNTPLGRGVPSPAQLLFGRRLRGHVPIRNDLLNPRIVVDNFKKTNIRRQKTQKHYHDRNAKDLETLKPNDLVMIQIDGKSWEPGKVIAIDRNRPRSYVVRVEKNNKLFIRNRKFLRKFDVNNCENNKYFYECLDQFLENKQASEPVIKVNSPSSIEEGNERNTEKVPTESKPVNSGESNIMDTPNMTTRSGRVIRKPSHFKDFV